MTTTDTYRINSRPALQETAHYTILLIANSPCKATLVGVGIIVMIGGAVAAGVLYSYLGYVSLSCLAAMPIGIALIVAGIRYMGSQSKINDVPWIKLNSQEVKDLFRLDHYQYQIETTRRLRALNKDSLAVVGQHLDAQHLLLLDDSQLNDLFSRSSYTNHLWDDNKSALTTAVKALFPTGEGELSRSDYQAERNNTKRKLQALDKETLRDLKPYLSIEHFDLLVRSDIISV
jgi:hypothetical protein